MSGLFTVRSMPAGSYVNPQKCYLYELCLLKLSCFGSIMFDSTGERLIFFEQLFLRT